MSVSLLDIHVCKQMACLVKGNKYKHVETNTFHGCV